MRRNEEELKCHTIWRRKGDIETHVLPNWKRTARSCCDRASSFAFVLLLLLLVSFLYVNYWRGRCSCTVVSMEKERKEIRLHSASHFRAQQRYRACFAPICIILVLHIRTASDTSFLSYSYPIGFNNCVQLTTPFRYDRAVV